MPTECLLGKKRTEQSAVVSVAARAIGQRQASFRPKAE
jgi:hypothetical protein